MSKFILLPLCEGEGSLTGQHVVIPVEVTETGEVLLESGMPIGHLYAVSEGDPE